MQTLEHEPHHACGGGPIVSVIHAAIQLGSTRAQVLKYADSGDISGDKSSVVGYMAAAIW
jgi:AmmeMemoRadiSam system protein B